MKTKVWLSLLIISSLFCSACAKTAEPVKVESLIAPEQDTLGMVPDFSYVVTPQIPNVFVDQIGYTPEEKKKVYFQGDSLETSFVVKKEVNGREVYSGKLHKVKDMDDKELYVGDFSALTEEGTYIIVHPQLGDSYQFTIEDAVYEQEFNVLLKSAKEYTYTNVSDLAYVLANLMFVQATFATEAADIPFIEESIMVLLNSQDAKNGAFFSEIFNEPLESAPVINETDPSAVPQAEGTVSLTTTAQMAGVLAQYSVLYKEKNAVFATQCLAAAQKAYRYVEQYKATTDTDAWYYAAVSLYRATSQYKYRSAIAEYDAVDSSLYTSTAQGYTILADFIYLSTPWGTDYVRCAKLLEEYMDRAQAISVKSSQENFYVPENIATMSDKEILDDMIVLGVVNHVLSGQEYAGVQRDYIHYLSGANGEAKNYLLDEMTAPKSAEGIDISNIAKLLAVFGNMCE